MYLIIMFCVSTFMMMTNCANSSKCGKDQWQCNGGRCIPVQYKCDGVADCPDESDETFELCRYNRCGVDKFRCTYGGCVSKNVTCDGDSDCVDESDEMLPTCRDGVLFNALRCTQQSEDDLWPNNKFLIFSKTIKSNMCENETTCMNGEKPEGMIKCNGKKECRDGLDETIEECRSPRPQCTRDYFKCANGASVPTSKMCDWVPDCADGSDECLAMCDTERRTHACILPDFPNNGYYLADQPFAYPGRAFETIRLFYHCNPGSYLGATISAFCNKRLWWTSLFRYEEELRIQYDNPSVYEMFDFNSAPPTPTCIPQCVLPEQETAEYWCLSFSASENSTELQKCSELVNTGTIVQPKCRKGFHELAKGELSFMYCNDGEWNYIARCSQCGLVTSARDSLVIGGKHAVRGEMPWHAGIYTKTKIPYRQKCGGSLISTKIVVSAAHCFWKDSKKKLPEEQFAVAVGKIYRPWNETHDVDVQTSDVWSIEIPPNFLGVEANFQQDIALVILKNRFEYRTYVRPICLDFDKSFENRQLAAGNLGKVAGWGLTSASSKESPILKVVMLPYVDLEQCYLECPPSYRQYITGDKFCAGYTNGTALCKGDNGGGLTFLAHEPGAERYYLRGIVSTAPTSDGPLDCNAYVYTSFTKISKHEDFIKQFLEKTEDASFS